MCPWFIISEKRLHNFCFQRKLHQAPCLERLVEVDLDTLRDTGGKLKVFNMNWTLCLITFQKGTLFFFPNHVIF